MIGKSKPQGRLMVPRRQPGTAGWLDVSETERLKAGDGEPAKRGISLAERQSAWIAQKLARKKARKARFQARYKSPK